MTVTRLKRGDACPLCGMPIKTDDPFTLGYLSAIADLRRGLEPSISCDGPSVAGRIDYNECSRRLTENGEFGNGALIVAPKERTEYDEN